MAVEKKYAYMINTPELGHCLGIMYSFGAYYVASFGRDSKGRFVAYTIRRYKTLRGAENYLLRDFSYAERTAPQILYGTEEFIKKGSYWKDA